MWQGGSRVSGGKLVPEKSHWYLVEMAPDSNGAYHYVHHAPQEFVLTLDDNGTPIPLQLLPVSEQSPSRIEAFPPLLRSICHCFPVARVIPVTFRPKNNFLKRAQK